MASVPLHKDGLGEAQVSGPASARIDAISSAGWKPTITPQFVEEWDKLTSTAAEPNPFYESWHLRAALEACDPAGTIEVVQYRQNGELVGLLPIERSSSYYGRPIPHLRGWLHDNAFCGVPLVKRGLETAFWTALHNWASAASCTALFLHVEHLPENGTMFRALSACAPLNGKAAIVHRADRALLQSEQSAEDYFNAAMSGKKRKELRRQFNRLSDLGAVSIERETGSTQITRWIDTFLALEAAGWKGLEGSALASHHDTERLFRAALTEGAKAGRIERLSLTLDGRAIAMLVNFVSPPGVFSFKTAFDESYSRFSPGVLLQLENLALLDDDRFDWADSCAAADHPMIERIWREKRSVLRVSIGLGGMVRQAAFKPLIRFESGTEWLGE